jgi:F-type H+-transporting ATPase subunit gamma
VAGGQERILRRRIKSVDSTKKITRAMELIAATRVVKAQDRAAAARPYAEEITAVIGDLMRAGAARDHPLLRDNPAADARAVICITSDRGLCGAYNTTMVRLAERAIKEIQAEGHQYSLVVVGKTAQIYFRFRGYRIAASILGVTDRPTYEQARQIADAIIPRFEAGQLLSADICYWRFRSAGSQEPVRRRILPVDLGTVPGPGGGADAGVTGGATADLEYEPSPTGILNELLPRYVISRIFSATLDASASEYAAKQRAMKAATDNAEELKKTLSRIMNRARQDAITTEIMEILGGAEALGQDNRNDDDLLPDVLVPHDLFRAHLDYLDHTPSRH